MNLASIYSGIYSTVACVVGHFIFFYLPAVPLRGTADLGLFHTSLFIYPSLLTGINSAMANWFLSKT